MPLTSRSLVLDMVELWVLETPRAAAVVEDHRSVDYIELWRRSGAVAAGLRARSLGVGDRVAVLMVRGIEWVTAILGIMRAGCSYVPLSATNPAGRNLELVRRSRASLVIGPGLQDLLLPAEGFGRACDLQALERDGAFDARPSPSYGEEAYCIFTSGSTGLPKGIRVPHAALANFVAACPDVFGTRNLVAPRHLQFCEPSFDVHIFEVFHPLSRGGAIVVDPRTDFVSFDDYVDRIERQQVSIISPPTTFWHNWRARIDSGHSRWPRGLTRVVVGGEMAQPARFSLEGLPSDVVLMNGYGPAEVNYATVHRVRPGDASRATLPVGLPLPNMSVQVMDADGRPLPPGQTGEVCFAGVGVSLGYIGGTAQDDARFSTVHLPDGRVQRRYHTGDLGVIEPDGALVCLGRLDEQLKIQGVRVEPGEIEAQLLHSAAVKAVCVLAVEEAESTTLAMALELAAPVTAHERVVAELIASLRMSLPRYMVPSWWMSIDQWPMNSNGKVDRKRLAAVPRQPVPTTWAPQVVSPHEESGGADAALIAQLTRLWQAVRRRPDPIPATMPLRDVEPSSLRIGMFFAEVFDHYQLDVAPETFFGLATLSEIAERLAVLQRTAALPITGQQVAGSPVGDRPFEWNETTK
jgi:amino acid adenylation domain-containing protein